MFSFLKSKSSRFLGVDIGTAGIKVVELESEEDKPRLRNYASVEIKNYVEVSDNSSKFGNIKMSDTRVANDLAKIIEKAKIATKKTIMSVPTSSAFYSVISLPYIKNSEMFNAVQFEAQKYIPVPLNEVVFDWNVIKEENQELDKSGIESTRRGKKVKILLVAVPVDVTKKYTNIAKLLDLDLIALETESFSLARSLAINNNGSFMIIDIGSKTTNITVVENDYVMLSHSMYSAGSEEITRAISYGFDINYSRAEKLKKDLGLNPSDSNKKVFEIIAPIINIVISEIKRIKEIYYNNNRKEIKKIVITGGSASLPGLIDYLSKELNMAVEIGNPWKSIVYNGVLEKKLKEKSHYFSIAVGLALKGFEKQI